MVLARRAARGAASVKELGFAVTYKDKPDTRRGILSTVASVYDPLGLACPFIAPAKRLEWRASSTPTRVSLSGAFRALTR